MKLRWLKALLMLIFVAVLSVSLTSAYLTDSKNINKDLIIGHVSVDRIHVYYEKDGTNMDAKEVSLLDRHKNGVYEVNISDANHNEFIKNLRIDVHVSSNVDSYMRLRLKDVIIRKTTNYQGDITETAVTHEPTIFNLGTDWHKKVNDINKYDTYYYFKNKVKQNGTDPLVVSFVIPYDATQDYNAYPQDYVMQLGIKLEIVQANYGGPLHNWNLANPPWGGNWQ